MTHIHPLFKVDNELVYDMIESAVRGHDVATTIAPFHCTRDGRKFLLALKSQHAGKAIYDQLVKEAENVLKNRQWSGTTSITLQQHMGLHRKAFITLSECAEQIPADVPNDQLELRTCSIPSRQLIQMFLLQWRQFIRMKLTRE